MNIGFPKPKTRQPGTQHSRPTTTPNPTCKGTASGARGTGRWANHPSPAKDHPRTRPRLYQKRPLPHFPTQPRIASGGPTTPTQTKTTPKPPEAVLATESARRNVRVAHRAVPISGYRTVLSPVPGSSCRKFGILRCQAGPPLFRQHLKPASLVRGLTRATSSTISARCRVSGSASAIMVSRRAMFFNDIFCRRRNQRSRPANNDKVALRLWQLLAILANVVPMPLSGELSFARMLAVSATSHFQTRLADRRCASTTRAIIGQGNGSRCAGDSGRIQQGTDARR